MSTLTTDQMLQEAIEPLNNRFKYINEQAAINGRKGYHEYLDPSFDFIASDGHTLSVKFFRNPNPGAAAELKATNNQQLYTVISKTGILSGYPCLTTGQGDLIFVHDPTESCADKIIQSHNKFTDPQEWWLDRKRPHMDKGAEHIPRPMNAFIIYRNAQMATVRQQHPGIGNNDVSRIIGKKWQALDPKSRAHYKSLASRSAQEHSAKHPGYKYTPRKSEDVVRRRKRSGVALEAKPKRIRNRRIHHGTDSIEVPLTPVQPTIAEFPDLDSLTNAWAEDPTPAHFEALMNGFDCALEFTAL